MVAKMLGLRRRQETEAQRSPLLQHSRLQIGSNAIQVDGGLLGGESAVLEFGYDSDGSMLATHLDQVVHEFIIKGNEFSQEVPAGLEEHFKLGQGIKWRRLRLALQPQIDLVPGVVEALVQTRPFT